ncbi:DNA-directed RNA polymerase specialized sigma24 family protein [Friedmanniella endophytica]|uniref:DNA-directed RNA polymerase specialized sigma24 family protein n=1 Tax=Microlunatus kandeliicorticis TaxID=1759536 RepID=A0A7W3IRC4_9ACTN|nr:hypothetical protein [Microlunatus kandeliicorticis]MBA8793823.1 DNA-directed RNA polymerase specialized sigma24 family protein [Microlunatus kandeliicorticis]
MVTRNAGDAAFAAFARRHRPGLAGAALLLHGDPVQAERLVDWVLARVHAHDGQYFAQATDLLVHTDPRSLVLPWDRRGRVELVDRTTDPEPARSARSTSAPVVDRLAELPEVTRRVLVLRHRLGLSTVGTAELLGLGTDEVEAVAARGLLQLSDVGTPAGGGAVGAIARLQVGPADGPDLDALVHDDVRHGRQLVRRRRVRTSAVAAVAAAVLLVIGIAVWPDRVTQDVVGPAPVPTPTATASADEVTCMDPQDTTCRVQITRVWRYRMFAIVAAEVDPKARYFNGYSYRYDTRYDSDALWNGQGGALGLDIFNDKGGTQVFVQVASSRKTAVRCGEITHQRCVRQQMMDFNFFTMTDTNDARQGVEVQYCPAGREVITLVARNVDKRKTWPVTRAQLLAVIQDPGLHLPPV